MGRKKEIHLSRLTGIFAYFIFCEKKEYEKKPRTNLAENSIKAFRACFPSYGTLLSMKAIMVPSSSTVENHEEGMLIILEVYLKTMSITILQK